MSFVARRVLAAATTVLVIVTANFFLFRAAPGDPVSALAAGNTQLTAERQAALRAQLGYDRSILTQYVDYGGELARGNLGSSTSRDQPVAEVVRGALGRTIPMVLAGTLLAIAIGFWIGELAAFYRGGARDHLGMGASVVLYSLPAQWVGLMLLFAFSGTLPSGGMRDDFLIGASFGEQAQDYLRHLVLPVTTLAIALIGQFALVTRAAFLDTLSQDYVLTARGKGLRPKQVLRRHARRNALLPVVALSAVTIGQITGGVLLIETVFSWPGIGRETVSAIAARDYPLLQGIFLVFAFTVVAFNLLGDLLLARLDPRLRQ